MVAPRKKHPRNIHFIAAVQEEINTSNNYREVERLKTGQKKRPRLSLARLAMMVGNYNRLFYKINYGDEVPTWDLIKKIAYIIPSARGRSFDVAQKLIEAVARDTGKINIEVDLEDPECRGRIKFLARDAALEMTSKEQPNV